jgi:hypothetical protein
MWSLKKPQLLPIPSLPSLAHIPTSSILLSILFITPPSHSPQSLSFSGDQALPPSHLMISSVLVSVSVSVSVSEARSIIDWLTTDPSDVTFAFPDAPILTLISQIVSTPEGRFDTSINSYRIGRRVLTFLFQPSASVPDLPQAPSTSVSDTVGTEGQKGQRRKGSNEGIKGGLIG